MTPKIFQGVSKHFIYNFLVLFIGKHALSTRHSDRLHISLFHLSTIVYYFVESCSRQMKPIYVLNEQEYLIGFYCITFWVVVNVCAVIYNLGLYM